MLYLSSASTIVVAQTESSGSTLGFLLPIAILGGLFYLLLVLPQRRRAKKAKELRDSIEVGDEVRTIGGIYGTIRSEDDETFTIDIGGGSTMRIAKRAISERIGDDSE
ncbi:MAG: preprotein translocase subunit YajC [Acidimicrobiia bacterium]